MSAELHVPYRQPDLSVSIGSVTIRGGVDVEPLYVTKNGEFYEEGVAFAPVTVDVEEFTPSGTLKIRDNGTYNVYDKETAEVEVWPDLEEKTVTPTEQTQTIEADEAYGLRMVTVEPIPAEYIVPSGTENIAKNGTYDIADKANVTVNVPNPSTGTLSITENGIYDVTEKAEVDVDVEGLVPTGTLQITENGTYDVTEKASAAVSVKQWDEELTAILDGTATELRDLPSGMTKIKPYAFYHPSRALPSDYIQLDSVHFGGSSVLFTDIPNNAQATVDIEAKSDGSRSVSQVLYGFDRGANGGSYFGVMPNSTVWSLGGGLNYSTALSRTAIQIGNTATPMSVTAIIDGVAHTRSGTMSTLTNIMIGGVLTSSNQVTYSFVGMVYGAIKAFIGSSLAYNYIPVKRVSDGKVGYYDSVNNVFKLPTGSELTGGAEIPSVETDSIESADLDAIEIGAYAFYNNELSSLTLRANSVVTLGEHAIDGTPIADGTGVIYVPADLVAAYQSAYPEFSNVVEAIA